MTASVQLQPALVVILPLRTVGSAHKHVRQSDVEPCCNFRGHQVGVFCADEELRQQVLTSILEAATITELPDVMCVKMTLKIIRDAAAGPGDPVLHWDLYALKNCFGAQCVDVPAALCFFQGQLFQR